MIALRPSRISAYNSHAHHLPGLLIVIDQVINPSIPQDPQYSWCAQGLPVCTCKPWIFWHGRWTPKYLLCQSLFGIILHCPKTSQIAMWHLRRCTNFALLRSIYSISHPTTRRIQGWSSHHHWGSSTHVTMAGLLTASPCKLRAFCNTQPKNATIYIQAAGSLLTAIRQLGRILVCIWIQVRVIVVLFRLPERDALSFPLRCPWVWSSRA